MLRLYADQQQTYGSLTHLNHEKLSSKYHPIYPKLAQSSIYEYLSSTSCEIKPEAKTIMT